MRPAEFNNPVWNPKFDYDNALIKDDVFRISEGYNYIEFDEERNQYQLSNKKDSNFCDRTINLSILSWSTIYYRYIECNSDSKERRALFLQLFHRYMSAQGNLY